MRFLYFFILVASTIFLHANNEELMNPKYLYKILSFQNWKATQSRKTVLLSGDDRDFIHLDTKNQLDRILAKYWSDAENPVILKIDADQLEGDLVFETNSGGVNQYYHLYNGFIPFQSIVKANVLFQGAKCNEEELDIVMIGDPILRQNARELTPEEILSTRIKELIEKMKLTMREASGVGLAAPQIGEPLQLIVIEDMKQSRLSPEKLALCEREQVPFHVVINPKMTIEDTEVVEFFEGCLSIPTLLGVVPRARAVKIECLNEKAEHVVIHAKMARSSFAT